MSNKMIFIALAILSATFVLPDDLLAKTTEFGAAGFTAQSSKIQDFLFGPIMRYAGLLGGAYGLMKAIVSGEVMPLIVYGGIALAVNLMPYFIDGVFVSGMLLP